LPAPFVPQPHPAPPPAIPRPATAAPRSPRSRPSTARSSPRSRSPQDAAVCRPRMNRPGSVTIAGLSARQSSVDFPPDQPGVSSTTSASLTAATNCSGGIGGSMKQHRPASRPAAANARPRRSRKAAVPSLLLAKSLNANWHVPTNAAMRGNTTLDDCQPGAATIPTPAVSGGENPRISGADPKVGTNLAVDSMVATSAGWQTPVNAVSRRRRWPKASIDRGLPASHNWPQRSVTADKKRAVCGPRCWGATNRAPLMRGFSPPLTGGDSRIMVRCESAQS